MSKIQPWSEDGAWMLVRGVGEMDTSQVMTGKPDPLPPHIVFTECWSDERSKWVATKALAAKFSSAEDALAYLADHRDEMNR